MERTIYDNSFLKTRCAGIADQEDDIDKSYEPNFSGPPLLVNSNVPRMDIAITD